MSTSDVRFRLAVHISYECAQQAIAACMDFARDRGVTFGLVVVDSAGHLVASARMDGAAFVTTEVASGKAFACVAAGGQSGASLAQRYRDNPMVWGNVSSLGYGAPLLPAAGGFPIYIENQLVGALGASGAPSDVDEAAVLHAIRVIGATAAKSTEHG